MDEVIMAFVLCLSAASLWGCSSKAIYGGMIGAGVGGLNGNMTSGAMIGYGVGGMIDEMEDDPPSQGQAQSQPQGQTQTQPQGQVQGHR